MLRHHNPRRKLIAGVEQAFDDIEGAEMEYARLALNGHCFGAQDSLPAHSAHDERHPHSFYGRMARN